MRRLREVIGVAVAGLTSRKVRTVLIMLGPVLGVAAIVSAIGINESSKGHLKAKLQELGTGLLVVNASSGLGFGQDPVIEAAAVGRVKRLPAVVAVTGTRQMSDIVTVPFAGAEDYYRAFPVPVIASGLDLPATLEVPLVSGRFLNDFDESSGARVAVIGRDLADEYGYMRGEPRTILLNGLEYGVIGGRDYVLLEPSMDSAVFLTFTSAVDDWGLVDPDPSRL